MQRVKVLLIILSLPMSSMLLLSCGMGSRSASSTTGTISGMVLDDNGKPLRNIHEDEVLVVTLLCFVDNSNVECLHEDFWDIKLDVLLDSICEEDNTVDDCLIHLGQNASSVDANGNYTITDVPPGEYGLVLIYKGDNFMGTSLERDLDPVQAGRVTKYDIETDLFRK
jgi:hypothetical protein